jgi:hypothetical protein
MSSSVRWHRATELFDGESAWNAVKERERKDVFEDVIFLLAKKEKEREKELRVENREFMISVFNSMHDVTYRTSWFEVRFQYVFIQLLWYCWYEAFSLEQHKYFLRGKQCKYFQGNSEEGNANIYFCYFFLFRLKNS